MSHLSRLLLCLSAWGWCLSAYAGQTVLTDALNQQHTVEAPYKRIVSLSPFITEILFDIGAGAQVVGTSTSSRFPEAAKAIPQVVGLAGINTEAIIRLNPDLIIAWADITPKAWVSYFEGKVPIFYSGPESLEAIADTYEMFGVLSGHQQQAADLALAFRGKISELRLDYQRQTPVPIFYQVWDKPLFTIGQKHWLNEVFSTCGAQNIFGEVPLPSFSPSEEAVIKANPSAIVISHGDQKAGLKATFWRQWPINASQNDRFFYIAPDDIQRPTMALLPGIEALCKDIAKVKAPQG